MKKSQVGALGCDPLLLLLLDFLRVINNFPGCSVRGASGANGVRSIGRFGRFFGATRFRWHPGEPSDPSKCPETIEGACWRPPLLGCWLSLLEDLQPGQGDGAVAGMVEFHANAASAQGGLNFLEPLAERMR